MFGLSNILLQTLNPDKATFGMAHQSTQGFTPMEKLVFLVISSSIILYIIIRVWWSLRKEKNNK